MNNAILKIALDEYLLNYVDNETPRRYFINGNADIDEVNDFANAIINRCIKIIEEYQIPVGNSPAGELACEWTYDALHKIRDEIKQEFGLS